MKHPFACGAAEHACTRRRVLETLLGAGAAAWSGAQVRGAGQEGGGKERAEGKVAAAGTAKQVLFLWLDGAMSQFESWDPKPGTEFGGPFQSIATRVPGVQLSELMPRMAERLDRISLVRSMHTRFEDHSKALLPIQQGDPKNRGVIYPVLGSAVAHWLRGAEDDLPPYLHIKPGSGGFLFQDAGFLGPKFGALALGDGQAPPNLRALSAAEAARAARREAVRQGTNERFAAGRASELPAAYNHTYRVAAQMARHAHLFDPARLPAADVARYGGGELARHLVQARQLLEAGVRFVKVTMYHWDTHGENFTCHQDGVPQVDQALAGLIDDLTARGLYDQTLVLVMSEFGRTPKINARVGRDHWPECWSLALGGGGIRPGVVVGGTNPLGTFNAHEEFDIGHVFHTVFQALGIDPAKHEYDNGGQPLPIAHDDCAAIQELCG